MPGIPRLDIYLVLLPPGVSVQSPEPIVNIPPISISTLLSPEYGAGPSPVSTSRVYDGDDPASLSGAVPATYTSSMHRDQPRTNIAYI